MRHMRCAAALSIALFLAGCASATTRMTPFETFSTWRKGPYYQTKRDGLTLAIEPMAWSPLDESLRAGDLLPVWVVLANGTSKTITVTRDQFTLTDYRLTRFEQWSPAGFYIMFRGSNFRFFYYGAFPFLLYPYWDDKDDWAPKYRRWDSSPDKLSMSILPEGELGPGESVQGALLFEVAGRKERIYKLRWRPANAGAGMLIMFNVETG